MALAGTPDEVVAQVRRIIEVREVGRIIILPQVPGAGFSEREAILKLFADEGQGAHHPRRTKDLPRAEDQHPPREASRLQWNGRCERLTPGAPSRSQPSRARVAASSVRRARPAERP